MKTRHLFALLAGLLLLNSCQDDTEAELSPSFRNPASLNSAAIQNTEQQLVLHWAPIHYQDTDVTGKYSLDGRSDYLSAINFDGDWRATNNWDNAAQYDLSAHSYYSVVETSTHWFILYAFFHPRDWTDVFFLYHLDQHENDLEGVLLSVEKDGSTYGTLRAAVTVAHSDFFSYVPDGSPWLGNEENVDGTLSTEEHQGSAHPLTAQEAKGHGLKAYPYYKINGDGIKYYPSLQTAEVPENPDDRFVSYRLVDIFEANGLWQQRTNTELMSSPAGDFLSSVGSGSANAPWAWNDGDDNVATGELATDPAAAMARYFKNTGPLDQNYVKNPYTGVGQ